MHSDAQPTGNQAPLGNGAPRADRDEVLRGLRMYCGAPGQVTEIRTFLPGGGVRERGYFNNFETAADEILRVDAGAGDGIYLMPNMIRPELLERARNVISGSAPATKDEDILRLRWLLIDIDPQRKSKTSSTAEELQLAVDLSVRIKNDLRGSWGFPAGVRSLSGNGIHLCFRIDLENSKENKLLIERVLRDLDKRFSTEHVKVDTACKNASRIWRAPGTITRKGTNTSERPWRMARILHGEPGGVVPRDLLVKFAGEEKTKEPQSTSGGMRWSQDFGSGDAVDWVARWILNHRVPIRSGSPKVRADGATVWELPVCPFNPEHNRGEAAIIASSGADGGIGFICHHDHCSDKKWADVRRIYEPNAYASREVSSTPAETQPAEVKDSFEPAPEWVPFPVGVFPEPLESFVTRAGSAIGCDPALVGLPLLSVLASVIGNTRTIVLKPTWTEPSILWAVVVCDSGQLKSPAFEIVLRGLQKIQDEAFLRHAVDHKQWERDTLEYDRDMSDYRKHKLDEPPEKPQEPHPERSIISDTTVEAAVMILAENPRGVLLARDEMSGWIGGFDAYKKSNCDVASWLEMYRAGPVVVDRKSGPTTRIRRAAVSITGTVQPGTLRRVLGVEHVDNGLLARILLAAPPPQRRRWSDAVVPGLILRRVEALLRGLYEFEFDLSPTGDRIPVKVSLTPEAKALFVDYVNDHGARQYGISGAVSASMSKLEGAAARFALVFHSVRCVVDPDGVDPKQIDPQSMEGGIQLATWFRAEALRVYALLGAEGHEDKEKRQLIEYIQKHGGRVSPRDLARGPRRFQSSDTPTEDAEAALRNLVAFGIGRWVEPIGCAFGLFFQLSTADDNDNPPVSPGGDDRLSSAPSIFRGNEADGVIADTPDLPDGLKGSKSELRDDNPPVPPPEYEDLSSSSGVEHSENAPDAENAEGELWEA